MARHSAACRRYTSTSFKDDKPLCSVMMPHWQDHAAAESFMAAIHGPVGPRMGAAGPMAAPAEWDAIFHGQVRYSTGAGG